MAGKQNSAGRYGGTGEPHRAGAGEEQSSAVPRQRDWGQRIPVVRLPLMPSSNHAAAKSRAQLIRNSRYESQFMPNKLLPTYRSRQFLIGRLRHKLTRV